MTSPPEPDFTLFNESGAEVPIDDRLAKKCMLEVSRQEACIFNMLEIAYVDEQVIRQINKDHLKHDYVTDIITFRYDEEETKIGIEATLLCCAPRILEQALEYNEAKEREFVRVLIHGLLHLAGYKDDTEAERQKMRERENFYLDLIKG